jgi:hypothetical protein
MFVTDCLFGPNFESDNANEYLFSDDKKLEFMTKFNESCLDQTSCTISLEDHDDGENTLLQYCLDQLTYRTYYSQYVSE